MRYEDVRTAKVFEGHDGIGRMCEGAHNWSSDVEAAVLTRQTNGRLFAVEPEWLGANTAALGDHPATSRRFALRMVSIGTIDSQGLVTEHRDYWDLAGFLAQVVGVGLRPADRKRLTARSKFMPVTKHAVLHGSWSRGEQWTTTLVHRQPPAGRTLVIGLLACAAMTILTACGGSQTTPETVTVTASSTQPTKLSGLQEYKSIQELADDLTRYGHTCTDVTPEGGAYYPVDGGRCTIEGKVMLLAIYTGESQVDAQLKEFELLREVGVEFGFLAGKNWTVNCGTRADCEKLQADLGGRIVASAPITPTR